MDIKETEIIKFAPNSQSENLGVIGLKSIIKRLILLETINPVLSL
jgi:hypothetical protein